MIFGGKEYEVGVLGAERALRLVKFVARASKELRAELAEQVSFAGFIEVLSVDHVYELTAVLLGISREEAEAGWDIVVFTELLAEVAEHNDVDLLVKNLQRVVVAFQS